MSMQFWHMSFGAGLAVSTGLLCALAVWHSLCRVMIALIEAAPEIEADHEHIAAAINSEIMH